MQDRQAKGAWFCEGNGVGSESEQAIPVIRHCELILYKATTNRKGFLSYACWFITPMQVDISTKNPS